MAAQRTPDNLLTQKLRTECTHPENVSHRVGVPSLRQHGHRHNTADRFTEPARLAHSVHDFTEQIFVGQFFCLFPITRSFNDFSSEAIDFIFRCSEGIPRNINNLCDNALLAGYAAGETTVGREIIEDIAETFDMLPRSDRGMQPGEEREAPARIFSSAGRAELWAAGTSPAEKDAEVVTPVPVEQR